MSREHQQLEWKEAWREPHSSQPHNPEMANAFFRAGEIEAWGRGIARIFNACRQGGAPEPELRLDAGGVWMTFRFDEAYLRAVGAGRTGQASDPVSDPVSLQVLQLLKLLETSPLSPSDLMTSLGLKHRHSFRTRYLHPALSAELVEPTIPEKPSSRLQGYRLTAAGRYPDRQAPPRRRTGHRQAGKSGSLEICRP
jgi:ATP-dependent DNA helicase RecG